VETALVRERGPWPGNLAAAAAPGKNLFPPRGNESGVFVNGLVLKDEVCNYTQPQAL